VAVAALTDTNGGEGDSDFRIRCEWWASAFLQQICNLVLGKGTRNFTDASSMMPNA
jgi:hypothetical protein